MASHADKVALHRRHEHERHNLASDHEKRAKEMNDRHRAERNALHTRHEAELMGQNAAADQMAQQPPGEAPAAAAPTPQAAGNAGPAQVAA